MRVFLRALLSFLDRKFPDVVVVTQVEYDALKMRMTDLETWQSENEDKIKMLQANLNNVNTAMGFSAPKMGILER